MTILESLILLLAAGASICAALCILDLAERALWRTRSWRAFVRRLSE